MTAYRDMGHLKIAEKVIILNDRAVGMLTRLYNIKKAGADAKSRPAFFAEKALEPALRHIAKRFPIIDVHTNQSTFAHVSTIRDEVSKSLSLYYYTFADLLELKDHILQLLTTIDACQCRLDIAINYELTAGYLNLCVNLVCLIVLLSRIDDRRQVLGLFNAAHELTNGVQEPSFPRLGQMVIDYEQPWRRLQDDFAPLSRVLGGALASLKPIYDRRNIDAEKWFDFVDLFDCDRTIRRSSQMLSLLANPAHLLYVAQTQTIACEYISLDVMERWIVLCCSVCPTAFVTQPESPIAIMWTTALKSGLVLRVFRDETMPMHSCAQTALELNKMTQKRVTAVKDAYSTALAQSAQMHAERRRFLRGALRELCLVIRDEPGLLGPKCLFVWMALSLSRDEVLWLVRHAEEWPGTGATTGGGAAGSGGTLKKGSAASAARALESSVWLNDRQLPELLHWMLELRDLVGRYASIIQRYHIQFVQGYDAALVQEMAEQVSRPIPGQGPLQESDRQLLEAFVQALSPLNTDSDLRALRLDWFRFQANVSPTTSSWQLRSFPEFAAAVNVAVFHLKMIDMVHELLRETSDLSIFCFHPRFFDSALTTCLATPVQSRHALSFAVLCAHFEHCLHELCPEEKSHLRDKALALTNSTLETIAGHLVEVVSNLCEFESRLYAAADATHCAAIVAELAVSKAKKGAPPPPARMLPGEESHRIDRHELTLPDKLVATLLELSIGVASWKRVEVAQHVFSPLDYVTTTLEQKLAEKLLTAAGREAELPARPSSLLAALNAYIAQLHHLDSMLPFGVTRVLIDVLLQQSQPLDSQGRDTLTALYTKWYVDGLLRRASTGQLLVADHLSAMLASNESVGFHPEQYTDPLELRALVQLIGPYGAKHLAERLAWTAAAQIVQLNGIVASHRETLHVARTHFDDEQRMRAVMSELSAPADAKDKKGVHGSVADWILQRLIIVGQILQLRNQLLDAVDDVCSSRLSFLTTSFNVLLKSTPQQHRHKLGELAAAMGKWRNGGGGGDSARSGTPSTDVALAQAVRMQTSRVPAEDHYQLSCLLVVAVAVCLPRLAAIHHAAYRPALDAWTNNAHVLPLAINTLIGALFHLHARSDAPLRVKEFIALASAGLLSRVGDGESSSNGGQSAGSDAAAHHAVYVLLNRLVEDSEWLTWDVLEECFPFDLIRTAVLHCHCLEASATAK